MISVFDGKDNCCGCTACKHICPRGAIEMVPDKEGFLYPEISQELCIDCGLCKKACAFQNGLDGLDNSTTLEVYAVKHRDLETRLESRSGGAFTAISDYFIDNAGVIYGASYDKDFVVTHKKATNNEVRNTFRGSKYVQSDLKETFADISVELNLDNQVMFTGTPCQTAGLRKYLEMKSTSVKELFLCDIVCHGTPSPKLFKDYLEYLERKHRKKVDDFSFRDKKSFGWQAHIETYIVGSKSYHSKMYTNLFYEHSALRPSCYNCKYTNMARPSDITLADFWGIEKTMPEIDDDKGVSLVLVNTQKGKSVFNSLSTIYKWESSIEDCLQPNLINPTKEPLNREQFWQDYYQNGFKFVAKKYAGYNLNNIVKRKLKRALQNVGLLS